MEKYGRYWIIKNSIPIMRMNKGRITLRGLHYKLVSLGMVNDIAHYKKVCSAMVKARWDGLFDFDYFLDYDRQTIGSTTAEKTTVAEAEEVAKKQILLWANNYKKNRWENQSIYPEVFVEKKTMIGVFEDICSELEVALNPCKGYPSLTFLNDAAHRFIRAVQMGKKPVIIYFGDYDCSGEDIPRSIGNTLIDLGVSNLEIKRIALLRIQVEKWGLPPAPTKKKDTRSVNWDGIGQVEIDAVDPDKLIEMCRIAIENCFDEGDYEKLIMQELREVKEFKRTMKKYYKESAWKK